MVARPWIEQRVRLLVHRPSRFEAFLRTEKSVWKLLLQAGWAPHLGGLLALDAVHKEMHPPVAEAPEILRAAQRDELHSEQISTEFMELLTEFLGRKAARYQSLVAIAAKFMYFMLCLDGISCNKHRHSARNIAI
jgi:hypothetical protein